MVVTLELYEVQYLPSKLLLRLLFTVEASSATSYGKNKDTRGFFGFW